MSAEVINPSAVAKQFKEELKTEIKNIDKPIKLAGVLASDYGPSATYTKYTRLGCEAVGIEFDMRQIERDSLKDEVKALNADPSVHGILVYYPVFGTGSEEDREIRELVDHKKDIEGLNKFWMDRLYSHDRYLNDEKTQEIIYPCTPMAMVRLILSSFKEASGETPLKGKIVSVFNRSDVVGRPLAAMLAQRGAKVYSFDIDGFQLFEGADISKIELERKEALAESDIVVTGIPSDKWPTISGSEIKKGALCLNFASIPNFHDDVSQHASVFIPRVGPMTIAVVLHNTLELYKSFHK